MIEKVPTVYILASKRHGTIYIGVTSDLCSRIRQHKLGEIPGFTTIYNVKFLVWFGEYVVTWIWLSAGEKSNLRR